MIGVNIHAAPAHAGVTDLGARGVTVDVAHASALERVTWFIARRDVRPTAALLQSVVDELHRIDTAEHYAAMLKEFGA